MERRIWSSKVILYFYMILNEEKNALVLQRGVLFYLF